MFQGSIFLVVNSSGAPSSKLVEVLEENDAQVYVKDVHSNDINYLDESKSPSIPTHIISSSTQFIEYLEAHASMIPITTAEWVWDSLKHGRLLNPKAYNPDPRYFLKDTFVCVADDLPEGDKEIIYGGVRAFGGQYLDALTRFTTHLIALDMNNDKSVIAASTKDPINIKIVLPHWIDECLKRGEKVDETPYLLPNPTIDLNSDKEHGKVISYDEEIIPYPPTDEISKHINTYLQDKRFYLAQDCKLSSRLKEAVHSLIERNGGKCVNEFDVDQVDVYIGHFRDGPEYITSCLSQRIIVGTLQWLYSIVTLGNWVLPINSNPLHYPVPPTPLSGFKNLKVSVTNYSGDARFYLSKLITIMGGTFTKTLTKENDILIAARPVGKKYDAVRNRWDSDIKIVNHLWLEECYANWKISNYEDAHFQVIDENNMESLLGRIHLNPKVLENWYKNIDTKEIDDSMSEDESTQPRFGKNKEKLEKQVDNEIVQEDEIKLQEEDENVDKKQVEQEAESQQVIKKSNKNNIQKIQEPVTDSKQLDEKVKEKENMTPPPTRGGRSAKQKAAQKLHSDMTDLNDYQQMSKSARKMKHYMEDLESSVTPTKKAKIEKQEDGGISVEKDKLKSPKTTSIHTHIITTGCELELTLGRLDIEELKRLGIKVMNDFSYNQKVDILIAPRIMRTEKFLKCLSQVTQILHPRYLSDILKKVSISKDVTWPAIEKEFKATDYSLEKIIGSKLINKELGLSENDDGLQKLLSSTNKGKVFDGIRFNLSANLNGGPDVITKILEAHGCKEIKVVKSITASNMKILVKNDENVLYVAHKTKDAKTVVTFKKLCPTGIAIDWDWCVKSIFKMVKEDFGKYKL